VIIHYGRWSPGTSLADPLGGKVESMVDSSTMAGHTQGKGRTPTLTRFDYLTIWKVLTRTPRRSRF
jgi:hypothetical protein